MNKIFKHLVIAAVVVGWIISGLSTSVDSYIVYVNRVLGYTYIDVEDDNPVVSEGDNGEKYVYIDGETELVDEEYYEVPYGKSYGYLEGHMVVPVSVESFVMKVSLFSLMSIITLFVVAKSKKLFIILYLAFEGYVLTSVETGYFGSGNYSMVVLILLCMVIYVIRNLCSIGEVIKKVFNRK